MGVAFSPDGRRLASASGDKTVKVWDLATRQTILICDKHTDTVFSVAFSADGRLLASGSRDSTVRVWDTSTGPKGEAPTPLHTLRGIVDARCVAFSPDGRRLAAGDYRHTLKVWDIGDSTAIQEVFTNHAHASPICHVGFCPDGQQLVSTDAGEHGDDLGSSRGNPERHLSWPYRPGYQPGLQRRWAAPGLDEP
jgi:WD40 repeat protein